MEPDSLSAPGLMETTGTLVLPTTAFTSPFTSEGVTGLSARGEETSGAGMPALSTVTTAVSDTEELFERGLGLTEVLAGSVTGSGTSALGSSYSSGFMSSGIVS